MSKKKSTPRPVFSQRFLTSYGRSLKREEVRLVQGYRGLSAKQQQALLVIVANAVIARAQEASRRRSQR